MASLLSPHSSFNNAITHYITALRHEVCSVHGKGKGQENLTTEGVVTYECTEIKVDLTSIVHGLRQKTLPEWEGSTLDSASTGSVKFLDKILQELFYFEYILSKLDILDFCFWFGGIEKLKLFTGLRVG